MARFVKIGTRIFNIDAIAVIYERTWGDWDRYPYAVSMIDGGDEEGFKLTIEEAALLVAKVMG